jgi:predicted Zn-dependent peptidase
MSFSFLILQDRIQAGLLARLCLLLSLAIPGLGGGPARADTPIPDRPEKLSFPPLVYNPPDAAQYRVELKAGPVAYVIPDRELPLVNLVVYIRAGSFLEDEGQEGLAGLTGYLMARGGTQSRSAEDLDERLDFLAAHLNSSIGEMNGSVSLNLLSKDLPEGLNILREVLSAPRFQEDKLALRKQQLLQEMRQRNDEAAAIEGRELRYLAYGENFWLNHHATGASVEGINRSQLQAFHRRWVHPANFVVAVNGDFDRGDMIAKLETLFKDWPYQGDRSPPIPTNTTFAAPGTYLINKDVNQGRVSIVLPGIQRDDPDYFPVTVMNDILGGGGFTSRIMNRVRSDEGLAYSASSHFPGGVYFKATFTASFQSKSRTVAYATSIILDEMKKLASAPPSQEELNTAKKSFVESFPRTFSTKTRTAAIFAEDELTGRFARNPKYWQEYRANIEAVTGADVQRVAEKYLHPDQVVILVVGQKADILLGHPDHPVTLKSLTNDRLTELPLRDPMTMKPMAGPEKQPQTQ